MRLHLNYRIGLVLVFVGTLTGCNSEPPAPTPEPPKVSVQHPEARTLTDYEEFNGWLAANKKVEVRARVRGHIKKVNFTDGEIVKKGALLFELDPRPFEADIGRAQDKQLVYKAQKVAADKEEARLKSLEKKGGASLQQVEKAEADAAALAASISAAENDIARAKLDLEYSRITADIDGRISKAELNEGNLVNAGGSDPLLTTIISVDPIRLYFNVDERSLQRYAKNLGTAHGKFAGRKLSDVLAELKDVKSDFTFALDGETGFTHKGTLSFGDNAIDPATGTIQVYGLVDNKDGAFVPGARVRVRLPIGKDYSALLVPDTAILSDQDKRYVLVAVIEDDKNIARRKDVTLGRLTDDAMRAILPADKLPKGEEMKNWWVIVDNLQRVRINYPVDARKPNGDSKSENQNSKTE
jgi:RND family efflux transporter MFP subunit